MCFLIDVDIFMCTGTSQKRNPKVVKYFKDGQ